MSYKDNTNFSSKTNILKRDYTDTEKNGSNIDSTNMFNNINSIKLTRITNSNFNKNVSNKKTKLSSMDNKYAHNKLKPPESKLTNPFEH